MRFNDWIKSTVEQRPKGYMCIHESMFVWHESVWCIFWSLCNSRLTLKFSRYSVHGVERFCRDMRVLENDTSFNIHVVDAAFKNDLNGGHYYIPEIQAWSPLPHKQNVYWNFKGSIVGPMICASIKSLQYNSATQQRMSTQVVTSSNHSLSQNGKFEDMKMSSQWMEILWISFQIYCTSIRRNQQHLM